MAEGDLLSTEQMAQMGLVAAVMSDESAKKRVLAIVRASGQLEEKRNLLATEASAVADQLSRAEAAQLDVKIRANVCDERDAELDRREAELHKHNEAMNAEKAAFEEVRANIQAEHSRREAELSQHEEDYRNRVGLLSAREEQSAEDTKVTMEGRQRIDSAIEILKGALSTLDI